MKPADRAGEKTGALEIRRNDAGDIAPCLTFVSGTSQKGGNRNRHRLDLAARDIDPQFGAHSRAQIQQCNQGRSDRTGENSTASCHKMSFGLKSTTRSFQIAYFSTGK
jgi:hypothetical protein